MPAWWNTPAAANSNASHTTVWPSWIAAATTIDLLTKPLNKGKAEIDAAPTMHRIAVLGIFL